MLFDGDGDNEDDDDDDDYKCRTQALDFVTRHYAILGISYISSNLES